MIWRMKTFMKILCLFIAMKSEDVFVGTAGEKVEIRCPHSDDYKYTPKYFCKHPCKSSGHVLIESKGNKEYTRNGRYTLKDMNAKFFTVTISDLSLKDAGYYYCGLNQWFQDTLTKVRLSVHPVLFSAAPVDRPSQLPENTIITTTTFTWMTTLTSAVPSSGSTPLINSPVDVTAVCAGVLSFLFFWILVALVFIYRKISDAKFRYPPEFNQTVDDVCYLCEETTVVYILDDPPKGDSSSLIYSTVHYCDHMTQEQSHSEMLH